jgi:hypothetical protein
MWSIMKYQNDLSVGKSLPRPSLSHITRIGLLSLTCVIIISGCTSVIDKKRAEERIAPIFEWNQEIYIEFLKQNMEKINRQYSTEYVSYDFLVDTDNGSTRIQNLFDVEAVRPIAEKIEIASIDYDQKLSKILDYVQNEYMFRPDPGKWRTVAETIQAKKGDCKSLSLLLMSLLLAADFPVHAAISNGHMWVNVYHDNKLQVLEVDKDPDRNKVYSIPGFYDNPLFKIFPDGAVKRKAF